MLFEILARRLIIVKTPRVMAVAVRYFEFDKGQRNKLLITEDPSLMFSTVQVACMSPDLTRVSLRSLQGDAKMRDPGNKVGCHVYLPAYFRSYALKLSQGDHSLNDLSFSVNQREPNSHIQVTKFYL